MVGVVLLVIGIVFAVGTAVAIAACLRLESWTGFVLAAFVVGWAVVVVEVSVLSLISSWTRTTMLAALALTCAASVGAWSRLGRPRGPDRARASAALHALATDKLVVALGAVFGVALVYFVALGLMVPPGNWDELLYHLPRMVLWIQQDAVAAIPDAPGANLDANPVAAEIPQATTLLLAGTDRFVSLFQIACLPIAALGIFGVARRLAFDVPSAAFGALLFTTFPAVALQAPTGYNDLALAAALVAAGYFALGESRAELALFALAAGLAVGTKVSGLLALPALVLFVLVAAPRGRRLAVAAAALVGALVGSWWYLYNLVRAGSWEGGLAEQYNQVPSRAWDDILLRLQRYATEMIDLAGVVGDDRFVFPLAAIVVLVIGLFVVRQPRSAVGAAAVVAVAPWLVIGLHDVVVRAFSRGWIAIGRRDVIGFFPGSPATKASTPESWFGPALALLVIATCVAIVARTSGRRRWVCLVACAGSPLLLATTNAAAFTWDPGRGRFFLFAAALAATTFGLLLRPRFLAAGLATVAVVTLALSLVHFRGRAMGIRLLEPVDELVAWTAPRWEVQSAFSRDHPEVGAALKIVEQTIPSDATIAIGRSVQMPLYDLMGGGPWRHTVFVRPDGTVPDEAQYIGLPLFVDYTPDPDEWRLIPGTGTGQAWRIYRRLS